VDQPYPGFLLTTPALFLKHTRQMLLVGALAAREQVQAREAAAAFVDAAILGSRDIEAAEVGSGADVARSDTAVASSTDTRKRKREAEVSFGGSGGWNNPILTPPGLARAGLPAMLRHCSAIAALPALAGRRLKILRNVVKHPLHAKVSPQELYQVIEDLAHAPLPTHASTSCVVLEEWRRKRGMPVSGYEHGHPDAVGVREVVV
jgi:hypothetical protein